MRDPVAVQKRALQALTNLMLWEHQRNGRAYYATIDAETNTIKQLKSDSQEVQKWIFLHDFPTEWLFNEDNTPEMIEAKGNLARSILYIIGTPEPEEPTLQDRIAAIQARIRLAAHCKEITPNMDPWPTAVNLREVLKNIKGFEALVDFDQMEVLTELKQPHPGLITVTTHGIKIVRSISGYDLATSDDSPKSTPPDSNAVSITSPHSSAATRVTHIKVQPAQAPTKAKLSTSV